MSEPEWVLKETVIGLHEMSLNDHGGSSGMRDDGMLDSALGKPLNQFAYGNPNLFDLAASYAYGIIKNHPFIDGNKRTGFLVATLMIELNGYRFAADEADAVIRTLALAAGAMSEQAYAAWLQQNSRGV